MRLYTDEEIAKRVKRKKTRKKIIDIIFYPIIAIIVLVNIVLLVQKLKYPNKIPNLFGYKVFAIVSGSMEPTINIGDVIIVQEVKKEDLKVGDIITFKESDNTQATVTHRIVNITERNEETMYETRGDHNNTNDEKLVKYQDIEGIYKLKIEKIGNTFMKFKSGTFVIIVIIAGYLIYSIIDRKSEIKDIRHQKREEREELQQNEKEKNN